MVEASVGSGAEREQAMVLPPLVDVHAHVYHAGLPLSDDAWHSPTGDATTEDFLSTLDAAGVHFAVLAAASIYGDYNDYMIAAARKHSRLRTTVIVDPHVDAYVLRQMSDDGVVGIRFQFRSLPEPPDLSSYAYRKLLQRVADLGWHVHLHDEGERLPLYIKHIEAAGPRLVIDHLGRPAEAGGLNSDGFKAVLGAVERGRTWVKLSGGYRLGSNAFAKQVTRELLRCAGPERLMWGSDWPFAAFEETMTYEAALRSYADAVPDPLTRRDIDMTALRFFFS
jgi:predicted TIM-barrel fold metal-dependent hydrolase